MLTAVVRFHVVVLCCFFVSGAQLVCSRNCVLSAALLPWCMTTGLYMMFFSNIMSYVTLSYVLNWCAPIFLCSLTCFLQSMDPTSRLVFSPFATDMILGDDFFVMKHEPCTLHFFFEVWPRIALTGHLHRLCVSHFSSHDFARITHDNLCLEFFTSNTKTSQKRFCYLLCILRLTSSDTTAFTRYTHEVASRKVVIKTRNNSLKHTQYLNNK